MLKKYVIIGSGARALFAYAEPLLRDFADYGRIVGVFDINPQRLEAFKKKLGLACPVYTDCDRMLAETKPDVGIVTTVDRFHHEYIVKCLEAGVDAVTEKPLTLDAEKCQFILDAEQRTGRKVWVTFNLRFTPYAAAIKEVMVSGLIGRVLSVHFEHLLMPWQGAEYCRRWHRRKENSGGLLIHKACHQFDLINWWITEEPRDVMAYGALRFFGPSRKERGERCRTCAHTKTCEHFLDIGSREWDKEMYLNCEKSDGYYRDRCVFGDDIDIEDTLSVNMRYSGGALVNYTLTAHSPWSGFRGLINGTAGRLELAEYHSGARHDEPANIFEVFDQQGRRITHAIPKAKGGHGGGDVRLCRMLFAGDLPDPLGQQAGAYAGTLAVLPGIAANRSIAEGRHIRVADLISLERYRPPEKAMARGDAR